MARTVGVEDDGERRRRGGTWWLWGLLLLVGLVILLLLLRGCGDDGGGATGAEAGGVAGETAPADDAAGTGGDGDGGETTGGGDGEGAVAGGDSGDGTAASGDGDGGEGAGGAAGESEAAGAGRLSAGGRSLLGAADLAELAGESVEAVDVEVLSLAGEGGFWVGTGPDDRVYVHMSPHGTAVPQSIRPGQRVSFTGTLGANPANSGAVHGLNGEDAAELERQGHHIAIDRGALAGG